MFLRVRRAVLEKPLLSSPGYRQVGKGGGVDICVLSCAEAA